jgi:alpha-D-xyloside xylohydrolase
MQYSTEKPADHLELRIYTGADADFTLYEDENDNYNYEQGKYATIPFNWNEHTQTLTIGERKGEFPGMLAKRTFQIVFVGKGHGCGMEPTKKADRQITYAGDTITVTK